jgi:hypothetical protein
MGVPEVILETPADVSRVLVKAYPRDTGLSALFDSLATLRLPVS